MDATDEKTHIYNSLSSAMVKGANTLKKSGEHSTFVKLLQFFILMPRVILIADNMAC